MRSLIKIIAALAVVALLALAVTGAVKLVSGIVNLIVTDGGVSEPDPMFAGEAELSTRPPELVEESGAAFTDNSANWNIGEETPVDMTAEDLAREADARVEAP